MKFDDIPENVLIAISQVDEVMEKAVPEAREAAREARKVNFTDKIPQELMNTGTPENLVILHGVLNSNKVKYKDVECLIEGIQKHIKNHNDRDLLLFNIFTHPKSVSYPYLFFRLFNYANKLEKTFAILKANFSVFIDNKNNNKKQEAVNALSEIIEEKAKTSCRAALINKANITLEVYCIALTFSDLFRPITGEDQDEFESFKVKIRQKILDALHTNDNIPEKVLTAISQIDPDLEKEVATRQKILEALQENEDRLAQENEDRLADEIKEAIKVSRNLFNTQGERAPLTSYKDEELKKVIKDSPSSYNTQGEWDPLTSYKLELSSPKIPNVTSKPISRLKPRNTQGESALLTSYKPDLSSPKIPNVTSKPISRKPRNTQGESAPLTSYKPDLSSPKIPNVTNKAISSKPISRKPRKQ